MVFPSGPQKTIPVAKYWKNFENLGQTCKKCGREDLAHGVIELPKYDEIITVCPSDFIITYADGDTEVVNERYFKRYYVKEGK